MIWEFLQTVIPSRYLHFYIQGLHIAISDDEGPNHLRKVHSLAGGLHMISYPP